MGQTTLFILFMITLMIGVYAYFTPKQQSMIPIPLAGLTDKSDDQMTGVTVTKDTKQLDITTNAGVIQIYRKIDELTREQKDLEGTIKDEKIALENTKKEISDLSKKANVSDLDVLRIKALGEQLQNEKSLLVANGQQLIDLNDQLDKARKSLAEERDAVNINTDSILQSIKDHNVSAKDQASTLFDNVKNQIEEERQKAQDQKDR